MTFHVCGARWTLEYPSRVLHIAGSSFQLSLERGDPQLSQYNCFLNLAVMPVSTRSSSGPKSNANSKEHAKTTRSAAQRVAPKPTQPKHNSSTYKSSSSKKINTTDPVPQNERPDPTTSLNPAQFLDSSGAGETLGFWTTFKEFMPSAERTCQFYGGECSFDLDGMADGTCMLLSPKIRVMSPFKSPGKIEVKSGANGLGSGSIRITRWKLRVTFQSNFEEKYLIPFRHIGELTVGYDNFSGTDCSRTNHCHHSFQSSSSYNHPFRSHRCFPFASAISTGHSIRMAGQECDLWAPRTGRRFGR